MRKLNLRGFTVHGSVVGVNVTVRAMIARIRDLEVALRDACGGLGLSEPHTEAEARADAALSDRCREVLERRGAAVTATCCGCGVAGPLAPWLCVSCSSMLSCAGFGTLTPPEVESLRTLLDVLLLDRRDRAPDDPWWRADPQREIRISAIRKVLGLYAESAAARPKDPYR